MKSVAIHRLERGLTGTILASALALGAGCESSDSGSSDHSEASGSYLVTVYYTAVESYHHGRLVTVRGNRSPEETSGGESLGDYPSDFVAAVESEGTGRLTTGAQAGRYLNWSYDTGFWLDDIPANAYGAPLQPFQTAAADEAALPRGTRFRLQPPLRQDDGLPPEDSAARRLLETEWTVQDQFTPGLGGAHHLDLYIGEEDRPHFTESSPLYLTLEEVMIERL